MKESQVAECAVAVGAVPRRGMLLMILCCLAIVGCGMVGEPTVAAERVSSVPQPAASSSSPSVPLSEKIKFKTGDGDAAFSLKPEPDGAKLVDAEERELARFNRDGSKLKIKGPNDDVLGYVIASDGKFKIEDSEQEVELWNLQQQSDGDWKLEDGQGQLIYKVKLREYGLEIEDPSETSLFKVKLKEGKTSLRDAADQTLYSTKDSVPTVAMASLGFESIESLPLQMGLMTMLIIVDGR